MKITNVLLFLVLLGLSPFVHAQNKAEGYFTSEANACATSTGLLVSIKKYNPTQEEINNAAKPSRNAPLNYLMAPYEAVEIAMYNEGFESKLYSMDHAGNILWEKTIGHSNKSVASPLRVQNGFIYTGESTGEGGKVSIQKIGMDGKVVWKTDLDSLNNVNDLYVDDKRVSALVSFDVSKRVEHKDGTFSGNVYPIYFFVQLDVTTGSRIKKEYQSMANYLSSFHFSHPFLNNDYSYILSKPDSAAFFSVTNLSNATIISQGMTPEHVILKSAGGDGSYHLLTTIPKSRTKKAYSLISDFYSQKKKYEVELPVDYTNGDRQFVFKTAGDSILTIIASPKSIAIIFTDIDGKAALNRSTDRVISPVIGAGIYGNKVYILQMEGRLKPGTIGKIRVDEY